MSVVFLMRYVLLFVRKSGEVDPFTAFYPLNFEQIDRIQKPTFLNSNSTWKTVNEEPLLRYDNTYSHLFIYFIYFFVYLFIFIYYSFIMVTVNFEILQVAKICRHSAGEST